MISRVENAIKDAMRSKDKPRLLVLRSLKTDLMNRKIENLGKLSDEDALDVVRKAVKSREQAAELYEQGGRPGSAATELAEAEMLREYLPQALGEDELRQMVQSAVAETGATTMRDMGSVMKLVLERAEGRADGKAVSALVRAALSS